MPIKPENRALYPKDWKFIRAEILERDEYKCKFCGLENQAIGVRDLTGKFWSYDQFNNGEVDRAKVEFERDKDHDIKMAIKIVLTIAHLDHDPRNNGELGDRPNLAALCQKCHLTYDAKHHAKNARKTRDEKAGMVSMGI